MHYAKDVSSNGFAPSIRLFIVPPNASELGGDYFDRSDEHVVTHRLVKNWSVLDPR
jgi:hypothetical protein